MTDPDYGINTIQTIKKLHKDGINRFSVIMRHSARHYDTDINMEPFMGLTEEGKEVSLQVGANLPDGFNVRLFSSYIGRCIETAYLIDKGYSRKNGKTETNRQVKDISPFYINDFQKAIDLIIKQDTPTFIRNWIDGKISTDIIQDAKKTAEKMFACMVDRLKQTRENSIDIFISHDWNMYLIKEFGLGLAHEEYGLIEYLEGVVVYTKNGEMYIANHQTEPKRVK